MTDAEFEAGVDAILLTGVKGHAAHRALDLWWTRYAIESGGQLERATRKWMEAIEGDHRLGQPYPLGARRWWQFWKAKPRPTRPAEDDNSWGFTCP